jgi:hypothetical protein
VERDINLEEEKPEDKVERTIVNVTRIIVAKAITMTSARKRHSPRPRSTQLVYRALYRIILGWVSFQRNNKRKAFFLYLVLYGNGNYV